MAASVSSSTVHQMAETLPVLTSGFRRVLGTQVLSTRVVIV